jgi:hypothetical protein
MSRASLLACDGLDELSACRHGKLKAASTAQAEGLRYYLLR